jgi:hypothetical protein
MKRQFGEYIWMIPDGFLPAMSSGILESHEAICLLNCNPEKATIHVTIYFEDRDPIRDIEFHVPGDRTKHIRTDLMDKDGAVIPRGIPYAMKVESDIPVIVQHSRMDSTQAENTLMTTIAYPVK